MNLVKLAGIAAGVTVAVVVLLNWADVKRYIKIEQM